MTNDEKIALVSSLSGELDEEVVSAYLTLAGQKILALAYPFDHTVTTVPAQYEHVQIDAAVYMLNKRGAEGELIHNENGVYRTYEDADLPASMLRCVVPVCGVVK